MTPVDEVEQVSLSASDPLPSLNTRPQGVTAYEDGQGVMIRMSLRTVNNFSSVFLGATWLQDNSFEPTFPNLQKVRGIIR
jgi:hypothetical protein